MSKLLAMVVVCAAACGSGDTEALARRVARLEAQAKDGQWWCIGATCRRVQAECEALRATPTAAALSCERRRVAFCIQATLCFVSLAECHKFAVSTASRVETCAGVE
jgi:hypothetical protein